MRMTTMVLATMIGAVLAAHPAAQGQEEQRCIIWWSADYFASATPDDVATCDVTERSLACIIPEAVESVTGGV